MKQMLLVTVIFSLLGFAGGYVQGHIYAHGRSPIWIAFTESNDRASIAYDKLRQTFENVLCCDEGCISRVGSQNNDKN